MPAKIDATPMRLRIREIEERLADHGTIVRTDDVYELIFHQPPTWRASSLSQPHRIDLRDSGFYEFVASAPDDITALLGMVKQLLDEVEAG